MQMEMCEMALEPERPRRRRRKLGGFNDYLAILQAILPSCDSYHCCHCAVETLYKKTATTFIGLGRDVMGLMTLEYVRYSYIYISVDQGLQPPLS